MPAKRGVMPQDPTASCDVAVIGGGVIGLAVAWRAAQRGHAVCVLERDVLGAGASRVAAGMLAPVTEADAGELALLELGLRSARAWPAFAAELEAAAGADPGLSPQRRARGRTRPRRGGGARARARAAPLARAGRRAAAAERRATPASRRSRPPSAWRSTCPATTPPTRARSTSARRGGPPRGGRRCAPA